MKRRLSLVVSMILALALVAVIPFAVMASDNTDIGNVETGYTPEGVAVTNAAEFAAMAADGTYYLANDITVEATYAADFTGKFDGNGKTVTVSAPLFKNLKGTVKNLKLAGTVTVADYDAGALAQRAENATVSNVLNDADVKGSMTAIAGEYTHKNVSDAAKLLADTTKHAGTGGLIGSASGVCMFTDCLNKGDVNGSPAGGIVGVMGYDPDAASFTFTSCHNEGAITDAGTDGTNLPAVGTSVNGGVGGVAGVVFDAKTVSFTDCSNEGTITSAGLAGGILAFYTRASNTVANEAILTIDSCTNAGTVNTANYSGGILGIADSSVKTVTINKCENTGDVIGSAGRNAGIVGQSYDARITDCINSGDISGIYHIGGIVGRTMAAYHIENCANSGKIVGTYDAGTGSTKGAVGGIGGYINADITVINCHNSGEGVFCDKANAVGGILGNINSDTQNAVVKNCTNSAPITSAGKAYVGGIIGDAVASTSQTVENCKNSGKITGATIVAGIVAYPRGGGVNMVNCENTGDVFANSTYGAGGMAGRVENNSTFTNCKNSGKIVTTTYGAGGIVGLINAATEYLLENCVNTADVTAITESAGGIVGYTKVKTTLIDCLNTGDVTASNIAGGIVGRFNNTSADPEVMIRCGNTGNVTATTKQAGGFSGYVYGGSGATDFKYCYSIGNVTTPEHASAGIAYINATGNINVSFCYFAGVVTASKDGVASAVIEVNNNAAPPAVNNGNIYYVAGCADVESYYPSATTGTLYTEAAPNTTAEALASGELTYILNAAIKAADPTITADVFYQTLGTDAHPVLDNTHKAVIKDASGAYVNAEEPVTPPTTDTTKPADTTTKPVDTTTKPVDTTTKPVDTTTKPVDTTTKPVDTTTAPVDTTTEPVDTTTAEAPVETTTAETPAETTAKPVDTTVAEPEKKGCGGFALAAQIVALLGTAITVVVIKKKA